MDSLHLHVRETKWESGKTLLEKKLEQPKRADFKDNQRVMKRIL